MIVSMTDQVLIVSSTVIPKYSFTSQKPASFTCEKNSEPDPIASTSRDVSPVLIRLATGSATVATVTASGVLAPLAADLSTAHTSLLVLAIGSGSLFFSHVNDAGFWLVKEYFNVSVVQNLKTWSAMETLISVTGLVMVLGVGLVV